MSKGTSSLCHRSSRVLSTTGVGVHRRVPVAGEVLHHGDHGPLLLHALHRGHAEKGGPLPIIAERPVADHRVVGIGPDVQAGGEVHVEAEGGALLCQQRPIGGSHALGVQSLPHAPGAGGTAHLRRHPVHPAPLLIHAEEQGGVVPVELLQPVGERRQLLRALHVAAKENHAAHLIALDGLHRVLPRLCALDPRHQELGRLLLHRHPRQGLPHRIGGGGGGRLWRVGGQNGGRGGGGLSRFSPLFLTSGRQSEYN